MNFYNVKIDNLLLLLFIIMLINMEWESLDKFTKIYYCLAHNIQFQQLKTRRDLQLLLESDHKLSIYNSIMLFYRPVNEFMNNNIFAFLVTFFITLLLYPIGIAIAIVYITLSFFGLMGICIFLLMIFILYVMIMLVTIIIDLLLIVPIHIIMKLSYNKSYKIEFLTKQFYKFRFRIINTIKFMIMHNDSESEIYIKKHNYYVLDDANHIISYKSLISYLSVFIVNCAFTIFFAMCIFFVVIINKEID
jgi:hypothetical protein